ncbi:unnamed protein product [Spirodela intermedia]|uniref:Uncharacterized protein n=1 Tax=Spirodela intermedia TaxID=51605 RepID=A0A7I8JUU2_SPIIN|nr:unnamed protein product [Spirodela intermedia]CAA6673515.1 unnamed protein product [Spirodela intermedia]
MDSRVKLSGCLQDLRESLRAGGRAGAQRDPPLDHAVDHPHRLPQVTLSECHVQQGGVHVGI